ncbi:unnamed protein product [Somion occarium]|uniref:Zn(2)-C6 fungal-type domain-containing protein n=1 Tax=Somion occarium TaxID=3059160 RepID=A0ABP1CQX8_9APHY
MSNNHQVSFDDAAHFHPRDQHQHFDLTGFTLPQRSASPVSFGNSPHSIAAYMQDVLSNQPGFPISNPSPFTHYWGNNRTVFTNPFLESATAGLHDSRTPIREPAPIRASSPHVLYEAPGSWGKVEPQEQSLNGTAGSAPSTSNSLFHNDFRNVYAPPQVASFHNYPASTSIKSPAPSDRRPWEMGAMAGSLDVNTGVYQRAPEHPRVRTAQACEKCRIRKAKCSGETPCQRCRSRGLTCEYAPERKMRGPNKVKRKSVVDAASARRASVASSGSSSDDQATTSFDSPHNPHRRSYLSSDVHANHHSPPSVRTDNPSTDRHSPTHSSDSASDSESSQPRRARPPRLNLPPASIYDLRNQMRQVGVHGLDMDVQMERSPAVTARRASVPSYLMEPCSRVPATRISSSSPVLATPRPSDYVEPLDRYSQSVAIGRPDNHSTYSHSRSSSGTSMSLSTPITPITLPTNNSNLYHQDFVYPDEFSSYESQFMSNLENSPGFATLEPSYLNDALHDPTDGWTNFDMEATPSITSGAQEKNVFHAVGHAF